jgi:hypothetical protein
MSYTVIPRIDYPDVYADDMLITYYSQDQRNITQDAIDQCRQEYVDLRKTTGEYDRALFKTDVSNYNDGNCGAYIMLPATINQLKTLTAAVSFGVLIGSAYRNPIYNALPAINGASESPHLYGKGIDVNPVGRPKCNMVSPAVKTEYAARMQSLYNAAPSPKLLEYKSGVLPPDNTNDVDKDGIPDVFDLCRGGADHVHIGSGN